VRRNLRLQPRPAGQRLVRQRRGVVAKAHDRAVNAKEAIFPLQGFNTGADGHGRDPVSIGHSRSQGSGPGSYR
ncbi:hypothetical protein B5P41_35695, partial [Bacillus sp. SRB_28]